MLVNIKIFDDGPFMVCRLASSDCDTERKHSKRHPQDRRTPGRCGPVGVNFVAREVPAHE
jgi:hypothetical protein